MEKLVNKTVKLKLVGLDGNAFALIGAFVRAANKDKWTKAEIELVTGEAMTGDYHHLLATLANHCSEGGE